MHPGRVPFQGNTPGATLMAQVNDLLPPAREINPNLSVDVAVVLDKALAKAPEARYETASDFVAALAAAGLPAPIEAGQERTPKSGDGTDARVCAMVGGRRVLTLPKSHTSWLSFPACARRPTAR